MVHNKCTLKDNYADRLFHLCNFVFSCVTFRCVTSGKEQVTKTKMAHAGFLLWLAEILNQEVIFVISNTSTFPTVRYLEHFN